MIAYTTIGTNNFEEAVAFYDAIFSSIGINKSWGSDRMQGWSADPSAPMFSVCKPWDGQAASCGNGTMIALAMKDAAQVDAVHAKALEMGASDDGAPGPRGEAFYCGYFKDLDGNKINAFCFKK